MVQNTVPAPHALTLTPADHAKRMPVAAKVRNAYLRGPKGSSTGRNATPRMTLSWEDVVELVELLKGRP